MNSAATILAFETSCDDTSVAVCSNGKILSNITASQKVHEEYGGVVPELAARAHLQHIVPVTEAALKKAGVDLKNIDAIAFTTAPGLIGSLLVGAQFAKSIALANNIPLIAVHHMQAHVLANMIEDPKPDFPFLCLTVSGGHTQIVKVNSATNMEIIGETLDDAAGEAFDKSAKMLGLPYPGGPLIDKYAKNGNPEAYSFPEPQIPGFNFSFSGLKTAIRYFLEEKTTQDADFINKNLEDICASIQGRIISILLKKLKKAAQESGIRHVCIAGGVSANSGLRNEFLKTGKKYGWQTYIPKMEYCTDNAGMIAITAWYKFLENDFSDLEISPQARASW